MRHIGLVIWFIIAGPAMPPTGGQSLFFRDHPLGDAYHHLRVDQVYQAADGWVWLGTDGGVLRYDGQSFDLFSLPDTLTDNVVSSIYQDRRGRLWVGFRDGAIARLDGPALRLWEPEEGLPKVPITGFAEDRDGRLWIATYGEGLYYLDPKGRLYNFNTDDGLADDEIYTLAADVRGNVWAGTDHGISICRVEGGRKQVRRLTREEGLPDEIVRTLLFDAGGNCWVGTYDGGVCRFDPDGRQSAYLTPAWSQGVVTGLALFPGRELWIGTETRGLWRLSLVDDPEPLRPEASFAGVRILDLSTDQEGQLWVVSNTQGVRSANRQFEFFPATDLSIQALHVDREQRLWVGTANGLYRLTGETLTPVGGLPALNILSIFEDSFGNLWLGTFGDGILCYHPGRRRQRRLTEADGLTNGSILDIDGRGDHIWLATLGGVTEFTCRQDPLAKPYPTLPVRNFNKESGLGINFIYSVFVDSRGNVWFGTDGKGVSVLRGGRITNYRQAGDKPLRAVYSIAEDGQEHIWFSTAREGLAEFDGRHFRHLGLADGLRDLEISTLVSDTRGRLLVVHPEGIDLIDPVSPHRVVSFGPEAGLDHTESNLNAVASDRNGRLWLGAQNRLIRYTSLGGQVRQQPVINLTAVSVLGNPADPTAQGRWRHDQNYFIFEYAGLWYSDPNRLQFRYRLKGQDLDWIISRDRQAIYSNLAPGQYEFMVSASLNDRFDESVLAVYPFTIRRPYWQSWWFISTASALTALLLIGLMRQRERRLRREANLTREKIESQYEALKSQINPHFLFNSFNTLVTIIEEDPALAVEYVEKLSDFYRSILQYRESELITLQEELTLVADYIFLLKKRYGDHLNLEVAVPANGVRIVPLSVQLLVENAVKHNVISRDHPLTIDIRTDEEGYLLVSNNLREKRTREPSTGFGLNSIIHRYQLLSDRPVLIEKTDEHFRVRLPLIRTKPS